MSHTDEQRSPFETCGFVELSPEAEAVTEVSQLWEWGKPPYRKLRAELISRAPGKADFNGYNGTKGHSTHMVTIAVGFNQEVTLASCLLKPV